MTTWQPYLEPSILPLVPSQFPERFRSGNPELFVSFLAYYYQWMQDTSRMGAATGYARGFLDLRDVDRTSAEFLVHVKQKYLNDLRFQTESDTRLLTKHAKDLYRAKGSPRALDLFFRLLYDEVVSLYYPKDDLMQASSGNWVRASYLELSLSDSNRLLEDRAISGLSSGAIGFVDSVIRIVVAGKLSDVAFVSAVTGNFETGEVVVPSDQSIPIPECPTIVGSLTSIAVDASGSGAGYTVGQVLPINSPFGVLGQARVANTSTQLGLVSADLVDGGYGYTNTSTLYVSDSVVVLSNLTNSNVQMRRFFHSWETVTQPQATFHYTAATGAFTAGQQVSAWVVEDQALGKIGGSGSALATGSSLAVSTGSSSGTGLAKSFANARVGFVGGSGSALATGSSLAVSTGSSSGTGTVSSVAANPVITQTGSATILSVSQTNSTAGSLFLAPLTGNVHANAIYTTGNAVSANLDLVNGGYVDLTATGWILGSSNLQLFVVSSNGNFIPGETVVQNNPQFPTDGASLGSGIVQTASPSYVSVANVQGVMYSGRTLRGMTSGAVGNVTSVSLTLGLKVTNSTFTTVNGNVLTTDAGTSGNLTYQSSGVLATFGVSPILLNTETYAKSVDYLAPVASAPLAGPYGFSGNATANATTLFSTYLTFQNVTVGSVSNVYTISTQSQIASPPFLLVVDGSLSTQNDRDLTLYYSGATRSFQVGEVITQAATNARGIIEDLSANSMFVGNLRMDPTKSFVPTTNAGTLIVGVSSGASANLSGVWDDREVPSVGRNAVLLANTISSNGAVTELQVVDSGFGYPAGVRVWIGNGTTPTPNSAYGIVELGTSGRRAGYYSDTNGFLSDVKKMFDGTYYQNFSYQITSSHQLEDYVDLLKRVVHVAGMAVFGEYRRVGVGSQPITSPGLSRTITLTLYANGVSKGLGSAQAGIVSTSPALSSGVGSVSGTSLSAIAGSSSGVGSVRSLSASLGSSTGLGNASAVGMSTSVSNGSSSGLGNASAVGMSTSVSDGSSTGLGNASAAT